MRLSAIFLVAAQAATIVAQASCFCECNRTPDASGCAALPRPASGNCAEHYLFEFEFDLIKFYLAWAALLSAMLGGWWDLADSCSTLSFI
ncbi:hypothetical protein CPAR01_02352 [Colletotrichum paranaense]|uniref:Secreted protein n=1 Tax=Colletotrichum paranaense TaxID=1914294 RepID=A0ABQ9SZU8_9PEZI|nr:uncharacterized protein CPAR01_02352 [Colletotrichum paranaense]KAK1544850.1 hypothetical protein CPAR01_02352 [Colletotrichum paranaense]